jgi:hypothetical protein
MNNSHEALLEGRIAALVHMRVAASLFGDALATSVAAGFISGTGEWIAQNRGKLIAAEVLCQIADDACAAVPSEEVAGLMKWPAAERTCRCASRRNRPAASAIAKRSSSSRSR